MHHFLPQRHLQLAIFLARTLHTFVRWSAIVLAYLVIHAHVNEPFYTIVESSKALKDSAVRTAFTFSRRARDELDRKYTTKPRTQLSSLGTNTPITLCNHNSLLYGASLSVNALASGDALLISIKVRFVAKKKNTNRRAFHKTLSHHRVLAEGRHKTKHNMHCSYMCFCAAPETSLFRIRFKSKSDN